jgi:hypothetical protein
MTGNEILQVAGELFASSKTKSEALCRIIVGRSYYAAYHLTLAFLADLGLPRTSDHKIPARWLTESGVPEARRAGRILDDLYEVRRRADYELVQPDAVRESRDLQFVKAQIEFAADLKLLIATCGAEPVKSQVRAGIEAYRQRMQKLPGSR